MIIVMIYDHGFAGRVTLWQQISAADSLSITGRISRLLDRLRRFTLSYATDTLRYLINFMYRD